MVPHEGHDKPVVIPARPHEEVEVAVEQAVKRGSSLSAERND